jgi:hypothetical protein
MTDDRPPCDCEMTDDRPPWEDNLFGCGLRYIHTHTWVHMQVWLIDTKCEGETPMKVTSFAVDFSSLPGRDFRFYVVADKVRAVSKCVCIYNHRHKLTPWEGFRFADKVQAVSKYV